MRLTVVLALALLALPGFRSAAGAQSIQAGAHYAAIAQDYPDQTRSGVGGFFVYSPRAWWGIDASTTVFFGEEVGGSAWQVLAGPRAGARWSDLAIFARVRPGFLRFADRFFAPNIACILIFPPPESCLVPNTSFALDLGGTVEVPVGGSSVLRLDLGDTLIRFDRHELDPEWTHNLQFSAGLGWRF